MKYSLGDSWDGFDGGEYVYDEHKEKKWRTGIWKLLAGIMAVVLIYMIADHVREIRLVCTGHMIEALYDDNTSVARYTDENGFLHTYNLGGYFTAHDGNNVRLYYMNDINDAVPRDTVASRLVCYLFFGGLFALSIWRIRRNS